MGTPCMADPQHPAVELAYLNGATVMHDLADLRTHYMLASFVSVLFVGVVVLLKLFLVSNYRQWKKSRDFREAIEQPKYDYMDRELGEDWRDR
jgi:hypothetical protein